MAMAYIKLYYDWTRLTSKLTLEEKGRLIDALIEYAQSGAGEELLSGNEVYVFPLLQQRLDRDAERYERACTRREELTRAYARLRNQEIREQETSNQEEREQETSEQETEPSVLKRDNNHWRTSARARGAAAQVIVDACVSEKLPCREIGNLHELITEALAAGLEPGILLERCRQAGRGELGRLVYEALSERGLEVK